MEKNVTNFFCFVLDTCALLKSRSPKFYFADVDDDDDDERYLISNYIPLPNFVFSNVRV